VPELLAHAVREFVRPHVPAERLLPRQRANRREPLLGIGQPRLAEQRDRRVAELSSAPSEPPLTRLARRRRRHGARAVAVRQQQRVGLRAAVRSSQIAVESPAAFAAIVGARVYLVAGLASTGPRRSV